MKYTLSAAILAALRGQPSPAVLYWDTQVPGDHAPAYRMADESGRLVYAGWDALNGRDIRDEVAGYHFADYFRGPDGTYLGPDPDGIYPILVPEQ